VIDCFGIPDHETETERFMRRKIADDQNLKSAFPAKGSNPTLTRCRAF